MTLMRKLCQEWADKEKVDLKIDFVTSQGDKLFLTIAAEAQARSGHDMLTMTTWYAAAQTDNLEPSDDVWAELTKRYGDTTAAMKYVGHQKGHWIAPPRHSEYADTALGRPHRHFQRSGRPRPDADVPGRRHRQQGTDRQVDLGLFS